jgi:hypothetical protein
MSSGNLVPPLRGLSKRSSSRWCVSPNKEKQTYWSKKTSEPYQDDHFFAPAAWKDKIVGCEVLPYDPTARMSDHGPVELVIDLPELTRGG